MVTVTRENAKDTYYDNLSVLESSLKTWTEAEINFFRENGLKEIEEYGMYYTALDYNSYVIVLKYLMKKG